MTSRHCRHRRPRWRLIVPAAAAVLILAVGFGMKAGSLVDELHAHRLVASASCHTTGGTR